MKTNQDGGGDSSSAAAKQLKELGAEKKYKGGPKYMDEGAEKKYEGGAKLSPKQEKMDKNKNGKIDGQDFKMMGANRMGYTQTPGAARKKMGDVVESVMGSPRMTDPIDPKAAAIKAAANFADSTKIAKTDKFKAAKLYGNMARGEAAGLVPHPTTGVKTQLLGKALPKGENPQTTEYFADKSKGMKVKTF